MEAYKAGFSKQLMLKHGGSARTVRDAAVKANTSSTSSYLYLHARLTLWKRTGGTQPACRTLQTHFRSAGTPAFFRLEKVMSNKQILKAVEKISPHHQTSSVEAFQSVILRFAPKNVVFPFLGMLCRLYLAVLYYNENADRPQAKTSAGEPVFKVHFPKAKKGECVAKPVKTEPTFHYVQDLMDLIFEKVFVDPAPYMEDVMKIPIPRDLRAEYVRPDKEEVIASYVSRFNQEGAA